MSALIADLTIILILGISLSASCLYIYKEKKKGTRCIGCPMAGKCPRKCSCNNTQ